MSDITPQAATLWRAVAAGLRILSGHSGRAMQRFASVLKSSVWLIATIAIASSGSARQAATICPGPMELQILGSGGPVPEGHRASSGYLVWVDGRSRILVDAGGGTFLRFGESAARLEDLDLIAISHFHADHVVDLVALIKAGFFSDRSTALPISGPSGNGAFPGLAKFLRAEFALPDGAFAYLAGTLDGSAGLFKLDPLEVDVARDTPQVVLDIPGLSVMAAPVRHGPVPALGYLVRTRQHTIAFSGDQNGDNPVFWDMVQNADILVMHLAVPEDADPVARNLHALPSVIGDHAQAAHIKHLVLSHLMARSLSTLQANLAIIRRRFHGKTSVATDLQCFAP